VVEKKKQSAKDESCRRAGPRSPIAIPVSIRTMDEEEARPVKLHNMSAGGMAIYPGAELSTKSRIEIILSVPYEISLTEVVEVKLNGEIIRVHSDSPVAVAAFVADTPSQA
jgi:PilZ domain